jgi:hypothetical protein
MLAKAIEIPNLLFFKINLHFVNIIPFKIKEVFYNIFYDLIIKTLIIF